MKISDLYDDEDRTIEILGVKLHWPFPIAFMLHGSGATIFGYRAYGGGKRPIITALRKAFEAISNAKYEMLYRFTKPHRYHIIYTDLPPAYHCSDARILYGAMKCLCEYVEAGDHGGEKGLEEFIVELKSGTDCEAQAHKEAEALAIYRWWRYERPADQKHLDELLLPAYGDDELKFIPTDNPRLAEVVAEEAPGEDKARLREQYRTLEEKIGNAEQTYLHRLIEIRRGLWI